MKTKKRLSGAAQLKAQGKIGVYLGLSAEDAAAIDAAAEADGRTRANFLTTFGIVAAVREAKRILEKSRK